MQAIDYQPSSSYYLSYNAQRHAALNRAQAAIASAMALVATGDPDAIRAGVADGRLAGCTARRLDEAEAAELAEGECEAIVERVSDCHVDATTGRWRAHSWRRTYNDQELDHWMGYYLANVVVLEASTTNRKGRTKSAWAHVCYMDPRDADQLLAIVNGEPEATDSHAYPAYLADEWWVEEPVPVECY